MRKTIKKCSWGSRFLTKIQHEEQSEVVIGYFILYFGGLSQILVNMAMKVSLLVETCVEPVLIPMCVLTSSVFLYAG
jgi:hypothetical protein